MNHATVHEWLTLRLYGELDEHEERALAAHLAGCAACRDFAGELARGLGSLPRAPAREAELPAGWSVSLAQRLATERRRRWLRPVLTFAAGLAAGLVHMTSTGAPDRAPHRVQPELARSTPFVPSTSAPPPAASPSTFAELAALARQR
jgi:predicted anti-sigma-YlaC factor YlaD